MIPCKAASRKMSMKNSYSLIFWLCAACLLTYWAVRRERSRQTTEASRRLPGVSRPGDYYGGGRPYWACWMGKNDYILTMSIDAYKSNLDRFISPPVEKSSCREVTSDLAAQARADGNASLEVEVARRYQFRRVAWEARFVESKEVSWPDDNSRAFHGKKLKLVHFQCNQDRFTDKKIAADGVLIFDANLDDNDFYQLQPGDLIAFEGTIIRYYLDCFFLRGISITNKGNLPMAPECPKKMTPR
jgi:hypothetical protein